MIITLSSDRRSEFRTINLGDDSFEVEVSVPTFADKMRDTEFLSFGKQATGEWLEHRLKSTLTGWRNLFDQNREEIAFSWENLAALCQQSDDAYHALVRLAHRGFDGLTDEDKKKN